MVELIIPPVITTDSGYWISDPTPVAASRGKIPNSVVNAVINTGRRRKSVASFSKIFNPTRGNLARNSSMKLTNTIPFKIAIAKIAKNPIMAETER